MKAYSRFRTGLLFAALLVVPLAASNAHAGSSPLVTTVQTLDIDADAFIDRVNVTFNQAMDNTEPVVAEGPGQPGMSVAGYTIIPPMTWNAPPNSPQGTPKTILAINLAEGSSYDTHATPLVAYTSGAGTRDLKTELGVSVQAWDTQAVDAAGPVLLGITAKDYGAQNLFSHAGDEMFLRFSEPVSVVGATPADRWSNLERAVTFSTVPSQGMACGDGIGVITNRNFPRPQGATDDPILTPATGASAETIHVRYLEGNQPSEPGYALPAIPVGCKTGIHADYNRGIVDAAGVFAAPRATTHMLYTYPADASLVSATTTEVGTPDGSIDALRLAFDLPLDDATFAANLGDFSVSAGDVSTTVTGFDTGTTVDDGQVTLILGSTPFGGVTPRIAYTRHSDCGDTTSGSTGTGPKARIYPLAGTHRACLGSFDATAVDGIAPVLTAATAMDTDGNGVLDAALATFSEDIAAGSISGWTIGGAAVTGFTPSGATAQLTVAEVGLGTGATPAVAYSIPGADPTADAAGNGLAEQSVTARDGAAPRLTSVTVRDLDTDGAIETAEFRFTETVTPADGAAAAFAVGGVTASEITGTDGDTVTVTVPGLTGTAARIASFDPTQGTVADTGGLPAGQRAFAAADVIDAAGPIGTIEISPSAPVGPGTTTIRGVFSEAMDATAPTVTFAGRAVTGTWATTPTTWEGTIDIATDDCANATGCEVAATIDGAKDARLNTQALQISRTTEIDTIAPDAPSAFSLTAGPAAPSGYVNAATTSLSVQFPVTIGDAAGGTAEALLDGAVFGEATAVAADADSITMTTSFASVEAFRAAVSEGAHSAGVKLCDDAANCRTVTDGAAFTADYTAVPVALTTTFDDVISGGTSVDIAWDGDESATDLSGTVVSYSTDGATFTDIVTGQAADGTTSWTVPSVDAASSTVRVTSTDAAGNSASSTSAPFVIDSSAPVVTVRAPGSFLGTTATIAWTVADASVSQVAEPMRVEFSTNGGSTWAPINGGSYSKVNDGAESWTVPAGRSFDVKVRVSATDAVDRTGSGLSARLASGVRGFVADRSGAVYGFGSSSTSVRETITSGSDLIRGLAVRRDGRSGYVLTSNGLVYPFAETGATLPARPTATRMRSALARGIALQTDTRGYIVDAYGRVTPFGGASRATVSRTWVGSDLARGIVLRADKRGGYVLDATGKLHPFRVGSYAMPRQIQTRAISSRRAVSVVLRSGERSGYILENTGRILRFGGAPAVANAGVSSTAGARSLIAVTATGGYWIDGRGLLRAYGRGFGAPAKVRLGTGRARGGAM